MVEVRLVNFLMEFFRDVLSGIWYYLYLIICIIAFFYVLGIVADRKRLEISKKLKEKKTYDIESGREAKIAAMESKQVLSAGEDNQGIEEVKKQDEPMVISSDSSSSSTQVHTQEPVMQAQPVLNNVNITPQMQIQNGATNSGTPNQNQAVEPLILNSGE